MTKFGPIPPEFLRENPLRKEAIRRLTEEYGRLYEAALQRSMENGGSIEDVGMLGHKVRVDMTKAIRYGLIRPRLDGKGWQLTAHGEAVRRRIIEEARKKA